MLEPNNMNVLTIFKLTQELVEEAKKLDHMKKFAIVCY
jgi:hypothetical protein